MSEVLTDRLQGEAFLEKRGKEGYRLARIVYSTERPTKAYAPQTDHNLGIQRAAVADVERNRLREWFHDHDAAWYPILRELAQQIQWTPQ